MDAKQIVFDAAVEVFAGQDMFTSVDVANRIKKGGLWISNSAVASLLHEIVGDEEPELDEIVVTRVEFDGFTASVYHPRGHDPESYVPGEPAMTPAEFKDMHGVPPFGPSGADDSDDDGDEPGGQLKGLGNDGMKFCFPYDK